MIFTAERLTFEAHLEEVDQAGLTSGERQRAKAG